MIKKRRLLYRFIISLVLVFAISGATALILNAFSFFRATASATNFLDAKTLQVDLVDIFQSNQLFLPGDTLNKDVYLINSGEANAVVRVKLTPSWAPAAPALLTDQVEITYGPSLGANWSFLGGWYYYNKILRPGESTTLLVDQIKLLAVSNDSHALDYSGAVYTLDVQSEALQANPLSASENWNRTYVLSTLDNTTLSWS